MSALFHMKNLDCLGPASNPHRNTRAQYPPFTAPIGLLAQIPPERIGVNGEYDHAGLAKRVKLALHQEFNEAWIQRLAVSQRGRVVVIHGQGIEARWIRQLTRVALTIEGAAYVEVFDAAEALQLVA
jgi:hypothetical protein